MRLPRKKKKAYKKLYNRRFIFRKKFMEEALRQLNRPLIDIDKMLEPFPLKEPQDEYTGNLFKPKQRR